MNNIEILINHVSQLPNERKQLVVLKGFQSHFLNEVPFQKLVSTSVEISIQELDRLKVKILPQVFENINLPQTNLFWCTYEELLLIGTEILNLFQCYYPC